MFCFVLFPELIETGEGGGGRTDHGVALCRTEGLKGRIESYFCQFSNFVFFDDLFSFIQKCTYSKVVQSMGDVPVRHG